MQSWKINVDELVFLQCLIWSLQIVFLCVTLLFNFGMGSLGTIYCRLFVSIILPIPYLIWEHIVVPFPCLILGHFCILFAYYTDKTAQYVLLYTFLLANTGGFHVLKCTFIFFSRKPSLFLFVFYVAHATWWWCKDKNYTVPCYRV